MVTASSYTNRLEKSPPQWSTFELRTRTGIWAPPCVSPFVTDTDHGKNISTYFPDISISSPPHFFSNNQLVSTCSPSVLAQRKVRIPKSKTNCVAPLVLYKHTNADNLHNGTNFAETRWKLIDKGNKVRYSSASENAQCKNPVDGDSSEDSGRFLVNSVDLFGDVTYKKAMARNTSCKLTGLRGFPCSLFGHGLHMFSTKRSARGSSPPTMTAQEPIVFPPTLSASRTPNQTDSDDGPAERRPLTLQPALTNIDSKTNMVHPPPNHNPFTTGL